MWKTAKENQKPLYLASFSRFQLLFLMVLLLLNLFPSTPRKYSIHHSGQKTSEYWWRIKHPKKTPTTVIASYFSALLHVSHLKSQLCNVWIAINQPRADIYDVCVSTIKRASLGPFLCYSRWPVRVKVLQGQWVGGLKNRRKNINRFYISFTGAAPSLLYWSVMLVHPFINFSSR